MIVDIVSKTKSKFLRRRLLRKKVYQDTDYWIIYYHDILEKYPFMFRTITDKNNRYYSTQIKYKVKDMLRYLKSKKLRSLDDNYEIRRLEGLYKNYSEHEEVYMDYTDFKFIMKTYYEKVCNGMVYDKKPFNLPFGLGRLLIIRIKVPDYLRLIDYKKTADNKKRLLDKGHDLSELKSKDNPDGIPYVSYVTFTHYCRTFWKRPKAVVKSYYNIRANVMHKGNYYIKKILTKFIKDSGGAEAVYYPEKHTLL